ncbi:MAG: glutaredoxin family protein [Gammaproteobacteria bacterium]|nr:glutaredoxin family protein [Gammaproteobacteria bacterium]MDH4252901.1 glutaredoxin family protein [Gammaproteobacteria bacterium]MDH5308413.1 glutaredoxin family protein [Gammaproteobacteria bacterium]
MSRPAIRVYSRPGCHLCEQLLEELLPLLRGRADVEVLDIDARSEWALAYGTRIPVVELDGEFLCQFHLDAAAVTTALERRGIR